MQVNDNRFENEMLFRKICVSFTSRGLIKTLLHVDSPYSKDGTFLIKEFWLFIVLLLYHVTYTCFGTILNLVRKKKILKIRLTHYARDLALSECKCLLNSCKEMIFEMVSLVIVK